MCDNEKEEIELATCEGCGLETDIDLLEACDHCGNVFCENCISKCDRCGNTVCADCTAECDQCGDKICHDCSVTCTDCNGTYCSSCIRQCDNCEEPVCENCSHYCDVCGNTVCDNCTVSCRSCGETFCSNCLSECANCGRNYCRSCLSECENCGDVFCCNCFNSDCNCCESCCSDNEIDLNDFSEDPKILDYNASAQWEFHKQPWENTTYMGIELEMGFPESSKQKIFKETAEYLHGKHIWKYDSSINGHGAELVITPHTLQSYRKIDFRKYFKSITENHGARSYDNGNCGLHVHVNAETISDKDYNKLRRFYCKHRKFIQKFGKRSNDAMEHYCAIPAAWDSSCWFSHYSAINPSGKGTYEFRAFRGTLKYDRFKSSLMFVQAIIEFVKDHGTAFIESGKALNGFFEFSKTKYPFLYQYLNKNNFIPDGRQMELVQE